MPNLIIFGSTGTLGNAALKKFLDESLAKVSLSIADSQLLERSEECINMGGNI